MDWRDYIVSDEKIFLGKPAIKGTRISVAHIISLFADGWSEQQILENYSRVQQRPFKQFCHLLSISTSKQIN